MSVPLHLLDSCVCVLRSHLVISLLVSFVSSPCFICLFTFHLCEVCALVSVSVFMLPVLFWRSLIWCGLFPVLLPSLSLSEFLSFKFICHVVFLPSVTLTAHFVLITVGGFCICSLGLALSHKQSDCENIKVF